MYSTKKLSEILLILRNWKSCKQTSDFIGDKITRIETISQWNINSDKVWYFQLNLDDKEKFSIKKWDILFSHINSVEHIWKIALSEKDYDNLFHWMNLLLLRWNPEIISGAFLYVILQYYFKSWYWRNICKKAINQASLNQNNLNELKIPLPPLSTQSLIVAKLDKAFANIDRQIWLLKMNIEDVGNMKKSSLEESFQWLGVQKKIMKDMLVTCEYGSSKKSTEDDSWVPVLRMWNIQNGWVIYDNLKYTSKESDDLPKLYLKKFDLLFNRTNSWELVGKTGIFLWENDTVSFAWYLIRLRFLPDILPQYANYYFNSEYFRKSQIEPQIDQQCGQANFSGWKLKETKFLYYPLTRQHEIVAHLDAVFDMTRRLRKEYEKQIRDLETMKQSLLEEAFAGRLVEEK